MIERKYYSQCDEDKWLLENFPELATRKGIFVEVGAYDGIESSNTLAFEQLGWSGICFEPSPESYKLLENNRPFSSDMAISTTEGIIFFHAGGGRGSHGIIANEHNRDGLINVEAMRLDNAIDIYLITAPHIDLISIDTEGTELDVWESRGRYRPEFVICEFNTYGKINRRVIPQFESDGYQLIHSTKYNHIFRAK